MPKDVAELELAIRLTFRLSPFDPVSGAEVDSRGEAPSDRALEVTWVQRPQDGSADADLAVVLAPSYVYYSASTVERVTSFFKTPQALDFSGLAVQASSQLDRARRLAAEYAAAALRSRPRLKLRFDLNAPKIAVPVQDKQGACVAGVLGVNVGPACVHTSRCSTDGRVMVTHSASAPACWRRPSDAGAGPGALCHRVGPGHVLDPPPGGGCPLRVHAPGGQGRLRLSRRRPL